MKINDNLKLKANRFGLKVKKYSPEILIVAGTVGVVASAIMACKATTKVNDILEDAKENIEKINEVKSDPTFSDNYSEEDAKKDLVITYTQTAVKLVKLYTPSIILGTASLTCIITSNNILRKRNVALAAAYGTIDKSFKEYRKRVADRFGEEVEHQIRYNIKAEQFEESKVNENGEEEKETKTVNVCDPLAGYSDYARFFDDGCTGWEKDPEYNLMFLKAQQQYANDLLRSRGHLFLNEVYDMLGIPRSKAGQVVGWIYDPDNPVGDNYVDFGIYDANKTNARDFVNGYERTILLDFNVDGNVWDLMS
ncbi:MAG: DUF6353 family protein [Candidatus Coprovivens sp.]